MQRNQPFIIAAVTLLGLIVALLTNIVTGGTFIPLGPAWFLLGLAVVVLIIVQISQNASPSQHYPSSSPMVPRRFFLGTSLGVGLVVAGGVGAFWLLRALFHSQSVALSSKATNPLLVYTDQSGQIGSVSWSPDGKYLTSIETPSDPSMNTATTVKVWNSMTGQTVQTYQGHVGGGFVVAWSPDGTHIASGGSEADRTIQIWEAFTGKHIFTFHLSYAATGLAWAPDGKRLASVAASVQLWDVTTGSLLSTFSDSQECHTVTWSSDGKFIATNGNKRVIIWDTKGTFLSSFPSSEGGIALSPNEKYLVSAVDIYATGNNQNNTQVWNLITKQPATKYSGHSDQVNAYACSRNSEYVASASLDATVQVWNISNGENILTYKDEAKLGPSRGFWGVAWSPDGKRIAAGGDSARVYVWQAPQ